MASTRRREPSLAVLVGTLSFVAIVFELVASRMAVFYLNHNNAFVAIPLALFGLALGSLRVHFSRRGADAVSLRANLLALTGVSFVSFAAVFLIFGRVFPISHPLTVDTTGALKTAIFVGVLLPPFYFVGKIFATAFARGRETIGRLYATDLFGAALACFATPLLLHVADLPYVIFACLLGLALVTAATTSRRLAWGAALLAVDALLLVAMVRLEGMYDLTQAVHPAIGETVRTLDHRWNEYSRVALVEMSPNTGGEPTYRIVHNGAESNVNLGPFTPGQRSGFMDDRLALPYLIGRPVDDVLVMFAGAGKQMIDYHYYSGGHARIRGVELNPLVVDIALRAPALRPYRLAEFLAQPKIEMRRQEGRYFLENDANKYDVIYVASDAPLSAWKTGHSRRYLDTYEAMRAYMHHLRRDGVMLFHCQPIENKLDALKTIWANAGRTNFSRGVAIVSHDLDNCAFLAVSRHPWRPRERDEILGRFTEIAKYLPGYSGNDWRATAMVEGPVPPRDELVTDDDPYIIKIDYDDYQIWPGAGRLKDFMYYQSWTKITLLWAMAVAFALVLAVLAIRRVALPEAPLIVYLVVTGFCYMLCEIAFIAKLELFMGNPLYSMALLLSIFLITNAAGSRLYHRFGARLPMASVPAGVAALLVVTTLVMNVATRSGLGLPLVVKVPLVALLVAPVGTALGMFYPFVVTRVTRQGREAAVPVTYALSTLSSVLGATYAMTLIVNVGYTNMLWQAAAGYLLLGAAMTVYARRRAW